MSNLDYSYCSDGVLEDCRTAQGLKDSSRTENPRRLASKREETLSQLAFLSYNSTRLQLSKPLDSCSFVGGYSLVELNTSEQPCLLQAYESITADRISQGWF